MKRFLSILLTLTMVIGLMSISAFAATKYVKVEAGATYDSSLTYYTDENGQTEYSGATSGEEWNAQITTGLWYAEELVTITVHRDSSYDDTGTANRTYKYYQVFRATYTSHTSTSTTDWTEDAKEQISGVVFTENPANGASYYLDITEDADLIAVFGSFTDGVFTPASGNLWFTLTKSADGKKALVTWTYPEYNSDGTPKTETVDGEEVPVYDTSVTAAQNAAKWIYQKVAADKYIDSGDLVAAEDGKTWTAEDLSKGYYLIKGSEGENLIGATTDIDVYEKAGYPSFEKTEYDEDITQAWIKENLKVAVDQEIPYKIELHVPADANLPIIISDYMDAGLEYVSTVTGATVAGLTITPRLTAGTDYVYITSNSSWQFTDSNNQTVTPYDSNADFQLAILPTDNTKGADIVITYSAKVLSAALTINEKNNTASIDYGNTDYNFTDKNEYKLYFGGIVKVDGDTLVTGEGGKKVVGDDTVKLPGVKFILKETTPAKEAKKDYVSQTDKDYDDNTENYIFDATTGQYTKVADEDKKADDLDKYFTYEEVSPATAAVTVEFPVTKTNDGYYIPTTLAAEATAAQITAAATVETDENGLIAIRGLDGDRTYTLTEIETVDGYNLLKSDVTLTLAEDIPEGYVKASSFDSTGATKYYTYDADNKEYKAAEAGAVNAENYADFFVKTEATYATDGFDIVENNKGSILPSTGGIGTTIFYIVGGLLAVGAGVVLVTKKRMGKEEN